MVPNQDEAESKVVKGAEVVSDIKMDEELILDGISNIDSKVMNEMNETVVEAECAENSNSGPQKEAVAGEVNESKFANIMDDEDKGQIEIEAEVKAGDRSESYISSKLERR